MSDKKFTLDEILNEYSPDRSKVKYSKQAMPDLPSGKMDTQKLLSDITNEPNDLDSSDKEKYADSDFETSGTDSDEVIETLRQQNNEKRLNSKPMSPVHNYSPNSLLRSKISFVNSVALDEDKNPYENENDAVGYDSIQSVSPSSHEEKSEHVPKIRKMNDSSRAKELAKSKKNKKNKNKSSYSYSKESPDGAYMQSTHTNNSSESKKSKKHQENSGKHIPFKKNTAIVEAENNSFSVNPENELDIPIEENKNTKNKSKSKAKTKSKQKNKVKKQKNTAISNQNIQETAEPESKTDILRDIRGLRNAIVSRIGILVLLAALSVFISASNHFHLAIYDSLVEMISSRGVSLLHTLLGIGAIFAAFPTVKYGFKRLFKMQCDCDTMPSFAIIFSTISSALIAFTPNILNQGIVHLFMPVAIVILIVNTFGKLLILNRAQKNIKFTSANQLEYAMVCVENEVNASTLTRGVMSGYPVLASLRKTSSLSEFLKNTYSSDAADKYCRVSSPIFIFISLIVSIAMTILRSSSMSLIDSLSFALSIFTSLIIFTSAMGISLVVNIPLADAAKKFSKKDGALLGYQSVDDFYDTNSILINASRIFPSGSVKLGGIKILSDMQLEENLFSAASLVNHGNSVLKDMFTSEIVNADKGFYDVSNFKYEDSFGICGWINNKRVLLGNREMMINHNIEGLPTKAKEDEYCGNYSDALYLAVSGNLSLLFIVNFTADKKVKKYLTELQKNNIKLIIKTVDFPVTISKINRLYALGEDMIKIIPENIHDIFDQETKETDKISASVVCSGKLSSVVKLLVGVKRIRQSAQIGVSLQLVSAILGLLIGVIYIAMGAFASITASLLFIYQLLFTVITVFIAKLRKV